MKTKKEIKPDPIKGRVCKNCGHVIYKIKYRGYNCLCGNPEPRS